MKKNIKNIFNKLKLNNNRGFAISTLIYGTIILFVVVLSALIFTMESSLKLLDGRNNNVGALSSTPSIGESTTETGGETIDVTGINCDDNITVYVGDKVSLNCTIVPNDATNQSTSYEVADENYAIIDEEGNVVGKLSGSTTITVKSNSNESVTDSVDVTVKQVGEPNKPELLGLTPIVYNDNKDGKWRVVSETDTDWYNYDEKKWANAAIVKSDENSIGNVLDLPTESYGIEGSDIYAMFVWIPRFSYKNYISDIEVKFVETNHRDIYSENNEGWHTHPAFWWDENRDRNWDENENLSGIWVGKFETGTTGTYCSAQVDYKNNALSCNATSSNPVILPNQQFTLATSFSSSIALAKEINSVYGINGNAHLSKNSEWVSALYLAYSDYGNKNIYVNNASKYTGRSKGGIYSTTCTSLSDGYYSYYGEPSTFCSSLTFNESYGTGASTSGTVYGIYDMYGGEWENVMAFVNDTSTLITNNSITKEYYEKISSISDVFNIVDELNRGHGFFEAPYTEVMNLNSYSSSYNLVRGLSSSYNIWHAYLSNGSNGFRVVLTEK